MSREVASPLLAVPFDCLRNRHFTFSAIVVDIAAVIHLLNTIKIALSLLILLGCHLADMQNRQFPSIAASLQKMSLKTELQIGL